MTRFANPVAPKAYKIQVWPIDYASVLYLGPTWQKIQIMQVPLDDHTFHSTHLQTSLKLKHFRRIVGVFLGSVEV